jgi:hypothetical protein
MSASATPPHSGAESEQVAAISAPNGIAMRDGFQ